MKDSKLIISTLIIATFAEALLIFIIYFNPIKIDLGINPELQSSLSAILNGLSALFLAMAFHAIKVKVDKKKHIFYIHIALTFSALFLVNYIIYHLNIGHNKFINSNFRVSYLVLLASHLITSIIALPMIFLTYSFAIFKRYNSHKKIAKYTFFVWEYVSITGVLVVLALKFLNH